MSNSAGPKIIRDNLVFNIDASNKKSYDLYADQYSSNVSLFLDGESLVDLSPTPKTLTNNNATISTTKVKYGKSSIYFNGTSGSVTFPTSSDFDFGSGNWTVEFYYYYNGTPQQAARIFQSRNGDVYAGLSISHRFTTPDNTLAMGISTNGSTWGYNTGETSGVTVPIGAWCHVAVVRNGSDVSIYVNGTKNTIFSVSGSLYYNAADTCVIGGQSSGTSRTINSYIEHFKVTKGVARYTASFTSPPIPSSLTDLTKNKNIGTLTNGVDYSSTNGGNFIFTSTSSQYISIGSPISTATSNISMSAWFKTNNASLSQMIFYNGSDLNGNGYGFSINNESTSNGRILMLYGAIAWIDTGYTVVANTWYHGTMNIMSDGSNEFYVNGAKVFTGISRTRNTPTLRADLGRDDYSATYTRFLNGNIALAKFYNRVLTATEIYNDFISSRGRFGV